MCCGFGSSENTLTAGSKALFSFAGLQSGFVFSSGQAAAERCVFSARRREPPRGVAHTGFFCKKHQASSGRNGGPQQADSSIWNWVLPKYSDGARSPSALEGAEGICFLCIVPILGSFFRFAKLVFTFSSRIPPRGRNWLSSENAFSAGSKAFVSVGRSPQWVRFFEWASSDAERWVFTLAGFVLQFPAGRAKRALP